MKVHPPVAVVDAAPALSFGIATFVCEYAANSLSMNHEDHMRWISQVCHQHSPNRLKGVITNVHQKGRYGFITAMD